MGDIRRCTMCYGKLPVWIEEVCTDCFAIAVKIAHAKQPDVGMSNITMGMLTDILNENEVIPNHWRVANIIKYGPMPNDE